MLDRVSCRVTLVTITTAGLAIAATIALAGCAPASDPAPSRSLFLPSATPSPSASASASPLPSAGAVPGTVPGASPQAAGPTAVTQGCLDLISADTMYAFDPNFSLDAAFTPAAGTNAAAAVASKGVACSWIQQTSGDRITVSVARPVGAELARVRAEAEEGTPSGSNLWFSASGAESVVRGFQGNYWITASSAYFDSIEDARPLISSVAAALR